jgi:lipid A 3-O-deacylase
VPYRTARHGSLATRRSAFADRVPAMSIALGASRTARGGVALAALALAWLFAFSTAAAQVPTHRLTVDNDFLAYWIPEELRTDRDYTHGTELSFQTSTAPDWLPVLGAGVRPCTGLERVDEACRSIRVAVAQRIYTPTPWRPKLNERPYAGVLTSEVTSQLSTGHRHRAVSVEAGATGDVSLAASVHTSLHEALGEGTPVGWENQLSFEPVVRLEYAEQHVLLDPHLGEVPVLYLSAGGAGSVGNLLTAGRAGLSLRAGYSAPHPWRGFTTTTLVSLYGIAELQQSLVVRDFTLDGGLFSDGPSVDRIPLVTQRSLGFGVRFGRVAAEYRARVRGREYTGQPAAHAYGTLTFSIIGRPAPGLYQP